MGLFEQSTMQIALLYLIDSFLDKRDLPCHLALQPILCGRLVRGGLKHQAVPSPRTANETIHSLTALSISLNLTVKIRPLIRATNKSSRDRWDFQTMS